MAVTVMATEVPSICSSAYTRRRLKPRENKSPARVAAVIPILFRTTSYKSSVVVRASKPQREEVNSSTNNPDPDPAFSSQEDLNYLWKLGAGSVVGAAAIKYGSIIFPEITRPNTLEAMTMVSAPVIVAVLLLIRQSRLEK